MCVNGHAVLARRGDGRRELERRNGVAERCWRHARIEQLRRVQRLHFDVHLLDEQHRERTQVRQVAAHDDGSDRHAVDRTDEIDDVLELRRNLRNEEVPIEQLGTRAGERRAERPREDARADDLGARDDRDRGAVTVQRERGDRRPPGAPTWRARTTLASACAGVSTEAISNPASTRAQASLHCPRTRPARGWTSRGATRASPSFSTRACGSSGHAAGIDRSGRRHESCATRPVRRGRARSNSARARCRSLRDTSSRLVVAP